MRTKLEKMKGAQFDQAYMRGMVDDHTKAVKEFETASETRRMHRHQSFRGEEPADPARASSDGAGNPQVSVGLDASHGRHPCRVRGQSIRKAANRELANREPASRGPAAHPVNSQRAIGQRRSGLCPPV